MTKVKVIQQFQDSGLSQRAFAKVFRINNPGSKLDHTTITRWKRTVQQLHQEEPDAEERLKSLKHLHIRSTIPPELEKKLLVRFENLRENGVPVDAKMMCLELMELDPKFGEIPFDALCQRMYRLFQRNNIVQRRVTRIAQNTRYDLKVLNDWVHYMNERIQVLNVKPELVLNLDETNIDYSPSPGKTFEKKGKRTIAGRVSGHSGRATAVLAVSQSGANLPPYVIFKAKSRTGSVYRELVARKNYPEQNDFNLSRP